MMKIFFQINNYKQLPADYSREYHVPLTLTIKSEFPHSSDIFYVQFSDKSNLIMLTLGSSYGELRDLTVVYSDRISFHNENFNDNAFLLKRMATYFNFEWIIKPSSGLKSTIIIDNPCNLEIYINAIKISLSKSENGTYIFYQSPTFGVITNSNLCITGFIILELRESDYQEFIDYAERKNLDNGSKHFSNTESVFNMNNYQCLIKKILELNNINLWKLMR